MEFTHEKFGKCVLKDLTQKMLEDFHLDMKGKQDLPLSVWRGDSVRAAVKQEFLVEPKWTLDDVDNAKPGHIMWLSECIVKLLTEVMYIDPLP
jgi:hypothetical protein